MRAVQGDLLSSTSSKSLSDDEYKDFDYVVTSMAFHHFADPALAVKRLAERLKVGGKCVVVDHLGATGANHNASAGSGGGSGAHGYSGNHGSGTSALGPAAAGLGADYIKRMFEDGGVGGDFDIVVPDEPFILDMPGRSPLVLKLFMARGTKTE